MFAAEEGFSSSLFPSSVLLVLIQIFYPGKWSIPVPTGSFNTKHFQIKKKKKDFCLQVKDLGISVNLKSNAFQNDRVVKLISPLSALVHKKTFWYILSH